MQLLAPMVRALSHRLAGRPLRERMRLLPIGAAVALAVIFLVSVTLGVLDPRSLTKIQRDYYPALRAGQDMRETLSDLQNALQNAAATQDASRLGEMDSLSNAFQASAAESRMHSDNRAHADALAQRFQDYYASVRPLTRSVATETGADSLRSTLSLSAEVASICW
jgi:type II secretory pathway component PulM